jgi:hypothetical protein
MMPLNELLAKTGLPQWDELGLPPIQELMKPVGPPRSASGKLPSRADVAKLANDTLVQVVNELLPPELKALASVQLPRMRLDKVLPNIKLPALPDKLPPLADLLKALPPVDPNARLPVPGVKLPPAGDVMKFLNSAADVLGRVQKPANMPSLQEIVKVVNSVSDSVNSVVAAAPAGKKVL